MATFNQLDVFKEAAVILQDLGFDRFTPDTMNVFLNAGIREIALQKPNSVEKTVTLPLAAGVRQTLVDPNFSLIRVLRNLDGPAITDVSREILDGMVPDWSNPSVFPFSPTVEHILFDVAEPTAFLVYPGNDGTGRVVAVVAATHTELPVGSTASDANTYTADVPLAPLYRQALVDYVISKCFTIDAVAPGSANRAQLHFAAFASAIGMKFQAEKIASPKTTYTEGG